MIRIGIFGYGNLGKGVELAIRQNPDVTLVAVFTRRDPSTLRIATEGVPVVAADKVADYAAKIDVMILCGGSATDLPVQTPALARLFHVVDSFDTHARIPEHFSAVDEAARAHGKVALISVGWDPGMFSLNRLYAGALLPDGADYTFWGKGVSQGHSDAIRRIEGVADAKQYTVPVEASVQAVKSGARPTLSAREKHERVCFVVAREGADKARIEHEIKTMPNYFADYNTTVHFVTQDTLSREHAGMPHGGEVIRTGKTGASGEHTHVITYGLRLDSNPEFTASVLVAFARAAFRLAGTGASGAKTVFDVPPAFLSPLSAEELRKSLL